MNPCYAQQFSDQMICHKCGLIWDMNDPDPPECQRKNIASRKPPKTQPVVVTTTEQEDTNGLR